MSRDDPALVRRMCHKLGIAEPDLDAAVKVALELLAVEEMAHTAFAGDGPTSNLVAMARTLDASEDEMRLGHFLASVNAMVRFEQRRERDGKANPKASVRDQAAIAEGVTAGVELAVAALRLARRLPTQ